jgi:DNA-binding CsgD family transcriptional regulator
MRHAIAWSYDLLDPLTQALLRQLAVFVGGFQLEAAEAVVRLPMSRRSPSVRFEPVPPEGNSGRESSSTRPESSEAIFAGLGALVDESLLQVTEAPDEERRFAMLETVREYALEQLAEAGEEEETRHRHAAYCLGLAEHADPWQSLPPRWLDRLQAEHDNLRAALAWSIARDPEAALRLAGGLWRFWSQRGYWSEGRGWLEQALAGAPDASPLVRAIALAGAGKIAVEQGDFVEARRRFETSLALAQQSGDERVAARALESLGVVASNLSEFDRAVELFEEALIRLRALSDQTAIGCCLCHLGLVADRQAQHERAIACYEEALPLARSAGDQTFAALLLGNLGGAYTSCGNLTRGEALYTEALDQSRVLGDRFGVAINLYNLADCVKGRGEVAGAWEWYRESLVITHDLGERHLASRILDRVAQLLVAAGLPRPAAHLLGAAAAHRREIGDTLFPIEEESVAETIATTRAVLGEDAFQTAWDAGEALSRDSAVAEVLAIALPPPIDEKQARLQAQLQLGLTAREIEVLQLVAEGWADKEIASTLDISRHTASKHVAAIRAKLHAPSRTGAVAAAREAGLL